MVRLQKESNKTYKMSGKEVDSRQIANATHYYHFRCIHKGKNKTRYIYQPQILKNTCSIYRNKCIAISVDIYCYIFLSSSSSYFCYEKSLPIHGKSLPRMKQILFTLNLRDEHVTQGFTNYNTLFPATEIGSETGM